MREFLSYFTSFPCISHRINAVWYSKFRRNSKIGRNENFFRKNGTFLL